jgi:hypothetical protein
MATSPCKGALIAHSPVLRAPSAPTGPATWRRMRPQPGGSLSPMPPAGMLSSGRLVGAGGGLPDRARGITCQPRPGAGGAARRGAPANP